ncbi:MAG: hypothetical protein H0X67_01210 [Acidobacteria bacterium]|nr:hypothetical protein [Acidobacteriota bacterium]
MPTDNNAIIQSLWVGSRLSTMERLAISSFLKCGHTFHLYCYGDVENVPSGAVRMDAEEILPASSIFTYQSGSGFGAGSPAAFSNLFRYTLLHERGGWWVDLDVVCLRYFEFSDARVLATERTDDRPPQEYMVGSAVMKLPPRDDLMAWLCREVRQKDLSALRFGDIGPNLMEVGVERLDYNSYLRPFTFFCPVPYYEWRLLLEPSRQFAFGASVYAVHLWHAMWNDAGIDTDATFDETCLYEQLKRRLL